FQPAVPANFDSETSLINPERDTILRTPLAELHIKKKTLALLEREPNGLRVTCLTGRVDVVAGGKLIALNLGEEIVVSNHELTMDEQTKADGVGRRRFRNHALGAGLHAAICDVSLISLLRESEHLGAVRHPRNSA